MCIIWLAITTLNINDKQAHHRRIDHQLRCVPSTIPSVVPRSTLARFVQSFYLLLAELWQIENFMATSTDGVREQGKLYVRGDSKIFRFQNGKTESLFLQRKNPRRIAWTILYRRMHKKGISEVSLSKHAPFRCNIPGFRVKERNRAYRQDSFCWRIRRDVTLIEHVLIMVH